VNKWREEIREYLVKRWKVLSDDLTDYLDFAMEKQYTSTDDEALLRDGDEALLREIDVAFRTLVDAFEKLIEEQKAKHKDGKFITGDYVMFENEYYKVICADDETVVIAPAHRDLVDASVIVVDYENLSAFSNDDTWLKLIESKWIDRND
jgi:hypothetical protein